MNRPSLKGKYPDTALKMIKKRAIFFPDNLS